MRYCNSITSTQLFFRQKTQQKETKKKNGLQLDIKIIAFVFTTKTKTINLLEDTKLKFYKNLKIHLKVNRLSSKSLYRSKY